MEKSLNFVYLTTNVINGKQYIGDHSTNNENLDPTYLGSGRPYLQRTIKEYGKENFKREILETFNTKECAFIAQEKYIIEHDTLVPGGYNISPQGGFKCKGMHSEESKQKMRGRIKSNEEIEKIRRARKGSKASEKAKENMRKTRREKRPTAGIKNGMWGSNLYEKLLIKYGKDLADVKYNEWKIKNAKKLKCPYCNKEFHPRNYHQHHGEKCKFKI